VKLKSAEIVFGKPEGKAELQITLMRIFNKWKFVKVVWVHVVYADVYGAVMGSRVA
jgi:hypothetical protein